MVDDVIGANSAEQFSWGEPVKRIPLAIDPQVARWAELLWGMATLEYRLLNPEETAAGLQSVPGWEVKNSLLAKSFPFGTYKDGVLFASSVGFIADALDHHPEIVLGYCTVTVSVNTHAVGGISPYDFELARRVEGLLA